MIMGIFEREQGVLPWYTFSLGAESLWLGCWSENGVQGVPTASVPTHLAWRGQVQGGSYRDSKRVFWGKHQKQTGSGRLTYMESHLVSGGFLELLAM